jgi:hypothetical protein
LFDPALAGEFINFSEGAIIDFKNEARTRVLLLLFLWPRKVNNNLMLKKLLLNKKTLDILIFAIALGMGIYFKWTAMQIITFLIFIGIILRPVSSRILAVPALFFLIITPFFLIFKKDLWAESSAIYAYYFLIMAVIMGIYEVRKEKEEIS